MEIVVVSIVFLAILIGMAKRRRSRRFRALPVQGAITLGALAADTVIKQNHTGSFGRDAYVISGDLDLCMRNQTAGEGPVKVGIAHGDYTAAEIEECLEATDSWDPSDKVANEKRRRQVREIGVFPAIAVDEVLNDGRKIRVPFKFVCESGQTIAFWAWNRSGAALTGGASVSYDGKIYVRYL